MEEKDSNSITLHHILDLLCTAGYVDSTNSDVPPSQKIAGGLSWCIAAIMQVSLSFFLSINVVRVFLSPLNPSNSPCRGDDNPRCIEDSLRLIGCPHPLRHSHIEDLDTEALFPVIQWLTSCLLSNQEHRVDEVCHPENNIEVDERKASIETLSGNLDELNHRKMNVVKQLDNLQKRINNEVADSEVQKLVSLLMSLKDLEKWENHFQSDRDSKHSELQVEIGGLERKIVNDSDNKNLSDGLHHSFSELIEKVSLMKKQLAARLTDIVAVRRQIDNVPCQSELIQYECRLSELYAQIQGKHRQTRKYYATYNALLEIKELMLKETSLLNSIISQFQEAFSSTDGRVKLVHSMEGIVKGSQQKQEKVQLGLQEEERMRNDLKDRYAAAMGEQKRCYSLFKSFQAECAKNERFRCQRFE